MTIREHYSHTRADAHKDKKRKEAEVRQQLRKQRTAKQQLKKLDTEGHTAKKERARLEKLRK